EREEPTPSLRPQVAGVLYRRLDAKTPLGVDATSRYKLAEWNDRKSFLVALRDPADTYNTRLRAGLPPGPIGAPAIESLMAALRPEKSEYWYYLHDADRNIHFSRTAEEHEAARRKYNVW
ncbi:endolytic transglycosylase MltG, partial [Myxococcota bacterium]|nr:endolytic transglycosylase MltG [Myxococcota bacterium]